MSPAIRTPLIANARGFCPSAATVRALLESGADPNLTDEAGLTALDYARRRAEELGVEQTDVIALISGERRRMLLPDELYRMKNSKRVAFQGEQALTSALLAVVDDEHPASHLCRRNHHEPPERTAKSNRTGLKEKAPGHPGQNLRR